MWSDTQYERERKTETENPLRFELADLTDLRDNDLFDTLDVTLVFLQSVKSPDTDQLPVWQWATASGAMGYHAHSDDFLHVETQLHMTGEATTMPLMALVREPIFVWRAPATSKGATVDAFFLL